MASVLQSFTLTVKTGARGCIETPRYAINGFPLEFEDTSGGTAPGEIFQATGYPESYPHALVLAGPEQGAWDLDETTVTYWLEGEEPYTVRLGGVTIDEDSDLNLWYDKPLPVYDV